MASSYDPALDVELESIEYSISHFGRIATGVEKQYLVLGSSLILKTYTNDEVTVTKYCTELDSSELELLEANTREIIRSKWRSPKDFRQFEGARYSHHGQVDRIAVTYEWEGIRESMSVIFSTEESESGTKVYSVPEVYVIAKQLSEIRNHRFGDCE